MGNSRDVDVWNAVRNPRTCIYLISVTKVPSFVPSFVLRSHSFSFFRTFVPSYETYPVRSSFVSVRFVIPSRWSVGWVWNQKSTHTTTPYPRPNTLPAIERQDARGCAKRRGVQYGSFYLVGRHPVHLYFATCLESPRIAGVQQTPERTTHAARSALGRHSQHVWRAEH